MLQQRVKSSLIFVWFSYPFENEKKTPMRNEWGRQDGKCLEYAWDCGGGCPFVF
jgi:hypothetical protein